MPHGQKRNDMTQRSSVLRVTITQPRFLKIYLIPKKLAKLGTNAGVPLTGGVEPLGLTRMIGFEHELAENLSVTHLSNPACLLTTRPPGQWTHYHEYVPWEASPALELNYLRT